MPPQVAVTEPPARIVPGLTLRPLMKKASPLEVPPVGAGFVTVTWAVPAVPMSAAGIVAVSRVLLTNVVVRGALFHCTTEPETKLLPLTVKVKAAPPATVLLGDSALIAGPERPAVSRTILATDGTPLLFRMNNI